MNKKYIYECLLNIIDKEEDKIAKVIANTIIEELSKQ